MPDLPNRPYEQVDHPEHYNRHPSGVECIEVIEHMNLNVGTAIKHLWRHGLKPGADAETDLRKAIWYVEREIGLLQKRREADHVRAE